MELIICFFHKLYIFYDWGDIEKAKRAYRGYRNCGDFENDLDRQGIIFCWDIV